MLDASSGASVSHFPWGFSLIGTSFAYPVVADSCLGCCAREGASLTHTKSLKIPGKSLKNPRKILGKSLENPWKILEKSSENPAGCRKLFQKLENWHRCVDYKLLLFSLGRISATWNGVELFIYPAEGGALIGGRGQMTGGGMYDQELRVTSEAPCGLILATSWPPPPPPPPPPSEKENGR